MKVDEYLKDINKFGIKSTEMKIYEAILEINGKLDDILNELRKLKHK